MDGVGADGGLGREGERAAMEIGEFEVRAAREDGFGDVGFENLGVRPHPQLSAPKFAPFTRY